MSKDALRQGKFPGDAVDAIVEQWATQRPGLDTGAKHVTGRVVRLAALFQHAFGESSSAVGLENADFGILAPLLRAGIDNPLTPTDLARSQMMTSGGMTAALDRLQRRGLIERVPNPSDRRGSLVRLTDDGRQAIEAAVDLQADVERRLLEPLSDREVDQLVRLLRKLLLAAEPRAR